MRKLLFASASLLVWTGVASAQTTPDSLITVNLQDVLKDIAVDLNVSENSIPVNVQLPINLAANVCDVDVSVLSAKVDAGDTTCAAVTGSQEVTQIVSQQIGSGSGSSGSASSGTSDDSSTTASNGTDDNDTTASGDTNTDDENTASDDSDGSTDDTKTSSTNSAKQFAPGQQEQPANEVAPGKADNPKAAAPGQMKKDCAEGDDSCSSD